MIHGGFSGVFRIFFLLRKPFFISASLQMILFPSRMCWDLMDSIFVLAAAHPKAWWILHICCFVDGSQNASGLFRCCFVNFFEGRRCFLLMILSQRSYLCKCNWTMQQPATNLESNISPEVFKLCLWLVFPAVLPAVLWYLSLSSTFFSCFVIITHFFPEV